MTETERHRIQIHALRFALRIVILQLDANNDGKLLPSLQQLQRNMEGASLGIPETDEALEELSFVWNCLFADAAPVKP